VLRWLWLWGPPVAQMLGLFWASSRSDLTALPGGISDKVAHFAAYALLSALALRATSGGRWAGVNARSAAWALLVACGYGALDELHQLVTPGRFAGMDDWIADAAGALTAIALGLIGARVVQQSSRTRGV
jgi:VanZ family protein